MDSNWFAASRALESVFGGSVAGARPGCSTASGVAPRAAWLPDYNERKIGGIIFDVMAGERFL
jgi:hypothetical protein